MSISRALAALLVAAAAAGCARSSAEPATREPPALRADAPGRPAAPDPGEQITPAELATIPEPVPASSGSPGTSTPPPPAGTLQKAPEGDSGRAEEGPKAKGLLWRVQVFATQDRDLAQRTAREAAQILHAEARVEYEGSRYKVRLGDFGSEEEAGALRDKAVRAGYPGAFRIRCAPDTTLNKD
jgi:sporulation related protein